MTEKTTKWVPVLDLKIESDDAEAAHAVYVKIVAALDEAGVLVEHVDQAYWEKQGQAGATEVMDADDNLNEINPVVRIALTVLK